MVIMIMAIITLTMIMVIMILVPEEVAMMITVFWIIEQDLIWFEI